MLIKFYFIKIKSKKVIELFKKYKNYELGFWGLGIGDWAQSPFIKINL